jgi:ArsR family metal-binding transcriptional regulator
VLGIYADKKISLAQLHQESEIIRIVADILLAIKDKNNKGTELEQLINKKKLNYSNVSKIQNILGGSTKANRNAFNKSIKTDLAISQKRRE